MKLVSICKDLGVELGKFETKPYIEAMKVKVEISYPNKIVDIIKARKASAKARASSLNVQAEPKSITSDPAIGPSSMSASEAAPDNHTLGK